MIIKKCIKCGKEFIDNSMFGTLKKCDNCSESISWSAKT